MQEDVLGTRRTVLGDRYDTCTRCGQAMPRAQATAPRLAGEGPTALGAAADLARPADATQDVPLVVLCPTCDREVAAGEPLEPEPAEPDDSSPAPLGPAL